MKSRSWGCPETSRSFNRGCPGPQVRDLGILSWPQVQAAGAMGVECNWTMSQRVGASRILGAPGPSVICQQGHPGRSVPPGTSLQRRNANVPAARSSFHLGLPRSQLLCLPASEPPLEAHLHSILATTPGRPFRCPKSSHLPFPVGPRLEPKQDEEGEWGWPWGDSSCPWPRGQSGPR